MYRKKTGEGKERLVTSYDSSLKTRRVLSTSEEKRRTGIKLADNRENSCKPGSGGKTSRKASKGLLKEKEGFQLKIEDNGEGEAH